ncbi:MAG TPA: hypothetical protein VE988_16245 [Gemmataceae bacterium]|nr:hypothetical protein [Gemmataceae bacterium]
MADYIRVIHINDVNVDDFDPVTIGNGVFTVDGVFMASNPETTRPGDPLRPAESVPVKIRIVIVLPDTNILTFYVDGETGGREQDFEVDIDPAPTPAQLPTDPDITAFVSAHLLDGAGTTPKCRPDGGYEIVRPGQTSHKGASHKGASHKGASHKGAST